MAKINKAPLYVRAAKSRFFYRRLVNWLLVRCQRYTSRVKEAFVC